MLELLENDMPMANMSTYFHLRLFALLVSWLDSLRWSSLLSLKVLTNTALEQSFVVVFARRENYRTQYIVNDVDMKAWMKDGSISITANFSNGWVTELTVWDSEQKQFCYFVI